MSDPVEVIVFAVGAGGLLVSAVAVVLSRSPLRAALYLILALCSSALLYVMLDAPFVAVMQVLVYAGAIMVLFVFVIMLLNLGPDSSTRPPYWSFSKLLGSLAVGFIVWRVASSALSPAAGPGKAIDGSVKAIGALLLTDYLFGFEAISILLLVAVVGAVVLGLKRLS